MSTPTFVSLHSRADRPSLDKAQEIVGGYIEMVKPLNGVPLQILCDEEARMKGLPLNMVATLWAGQEIRGNAILLAGDARWIG